MSSARIRTAAGLVAALLVFAACSSSGSDAKDATTTTTTTKGGKGTTTVPATTSTLPTPTTLKPDIAGLTATAKAALLEPADVGTGFTTGEAPTGTSPGPCNDSKPDKLVVPAVKVSAELDHSNVDAALLETIRIYGSENEASQAYAKLGAQVDCTNGTITSTDGTKAKITIGEATDISGVNSSISEGFAKEISGDTVQGVAAITRLGAAVLTFQFVTAPGTDTSALPTIEKVVNAAVTKALAA